MAGLLNESGYIIVAKSGFFSVSLGENISLGLSFMATPWANQLEYTVFVFLPFCSLLQIFAST